MPSEEMAASFEKYLYQKHRAVYVSPLSETATNLDLLDILIKTTTEGYFPSRPVLYRAGSIFDLGTSSSEEPQLSLSEGLQRFEEGKGSRGGLFKWTWGEYDVIEETFSSASALTGSLLAGLAEAELHFSGAKTLTCRVENLQTACVDKEKLVDIITDKEPRWKPDITKARLKWPDQPSCLPFGQSGHKLWVIHQVLYASKVVIKSGDSSKDGGRVCTLVPGVAPVAPASLPGAKVEKSHENSNSIEVTVASGSKFPGKFKFAFRALCFQFSPAGDYVSFEHDAGNVFPVHRGNEDDDERAHLRDLFFESPPEDYNSADDDDDEEEWDVQRLPICI